MTDRPTTAHFTRLAEIKARREKGATGEPWDCAAAAAHMVADITWLINRVEKLEAELRVMAHGPLAGEIPYETAERLIMHAREVLGEPTP